MDADQQVAERILGELRTKLVETYGYAAFEHHWDRSLSGVPERLVVRASFPRLARHLALHLADVGTRSFSLSLTVEPARASCSVVIDPTSVWREHPARIPSASLATQLLPTDHPVQVLTENGGSSLVSCVDGTVGWVADPLGAPASPEPFRYPLGTPAKVVTTALAFHDSPYLLGGTTIHGIDCSGLSQRSLSVGMGIVIPRHSEDQLRFAPNSTRHTLFPGDLVFLRMEGHHLSHVAVVTRTEPAHVIHASFTLRRVVEQPLSSLLRTSHLIGHLPIEDLVARHQANAREGRTALDI